ncbi:hypothetical protein [Glycomyces terrestris]|uniref:Uncharacterized protein n=1 Tax=Glycomyces terrestris TaxID=2493553 RepID=A0A426V124_9ACTN|nr:hypothetical protein [Glycomyces terrestris]RRS00537.1 hypothetical protein EIW28_08230 [Glycomyces terrestris]
MVLDESEIQRRMTRPNLPTLAERYAGATTPAERDRFYRNEAQRAETLPTRRAGGRPPSTVWVTKPILRTRGWTDAAIREFLPRPERHYSNPHVKGRSPMPIWSARTVGRAEATDEWQHWLAQSLARRGITLHDLAESIRGHAFRQRTLTAANAIDHYSRARFRSG